MKGQRMLSSICLRVGWHEFCLCTLESGFSGVALRPLSLFENMVVGWNSLSCHPGFSSGYNSF